MTTYPGLPGPIVCDYLSREESRARYASGTEFQIGKIELVSNTGTYVDTPFRAVLVQTDWDRHWGTDEYLSGGHPYLTEAAAEALRDARVALVGIDCLNIDSVADGERPVHTVLLGAGIPIVEHMTGLAAVPDGARFYAVPPPVEGMGTFPVRAFAVGG